jgi:hypothetical protein
MKQCRQLPFCSQEYQLLAMNFDRGRSHLLDGIASKPYQKRPVRHEISMRLIWFRKGFVDRAQNSLDLFAGKCRDLRKLDRQPAASLHQPCDCGMIPEGEEGYYDRNKEMRARSI